jgi:hypothetical protein
MEYIVISGQEICGKRKLRGFSARYKHNPLFLVKSGIRFIIHRGVNIGTGYAIKGVRELLQKEEGRKFVCELPFRAVSKGFEIAKKAGEEIKERRKSGATGTRGKRSRKINVE